MKATPLAGSQEEIMKTIDRAGLERARAQEMLTQKVASSHVQHAGRGGNASSTARAMA
jgi:hypothetical protein